MVPKKGDLGYKRICENMTALYFYEIGLLCDQPDERLATPADLASMGLVRQAEYDALLEKYNLQHDKLARLFRIIMADREELERYDAMEPAPAEPPHVWQVGQFALCPDGKVRRLTHAPFYCFHDLYECDIRDCTPVPRPPMPELLEDFVLYDTGLMCGKLEYNEAVYSLETWIYIAKNEHWTQERLDALLALAEWRKLVGDTQ